MTTCCVVRLEALSAFAALIALAIPELAGHICEGIPPSSEHEEIPNLTINPSRWLFEPEQALEQRTLPGNIVVWNVGQHSTNMTLSLVCASSKQRAKWEAQIIDLFLGSTHPLTGMHRPGVIVLPVTACETLQEWLAAFELETDEWSDANAFDRRYESRIIVTAIVPALTVQRPVYTLASLRLGLGPLAGEQPSGVDVVAIAADGTITTSTF